MIRPVIGEAVWQGALGNLLPLDLADVEQVLVVAPHPDDETLGAGGLIVTCRERGLPVKIVAVTDGEHAYPDEDNSAALAETRREEQTGALAKLGVAREDIVRLGLTDSGVTAQEPQLVEALQSLTTPRTLIVAPWTGDFHPDHEACGRAAATVAQRMGAELIFYFFWTWHRGTVATLEGLPLRRLALSEAVVRTKLAALAEHRSQLVRAPGEPILPANLLAPAERSFEVFHV